MIDLFRPLMSSDARSMHADALTPSADGRLMIGQGPLVDRFEAQFARYVASPRDVLALSSCTAALDLALHLCGVGPGDDVITSPVTCTATNSPVVTRWANPVWADVDPETGLIDPVSVARLVQGARHRPKAIMAIDWAGRRCDYRALRAAAEGIPIIQDAAHRGPTPIGDERGDYVCWSFQAIKYLTSGDGGALLCPDDQTTDRARLLRWFGLDRRSSADFRCEQDIKEVGFKVHMNDLAAALALGNLPYARTAVRTQRARAARYCAAIGQGDRLSAPPFDETCDYWLYTVTAADRDGLQRHMASRGIMTSRVHARNDTHSAFKAANTWTESSCSLEGVDRFDAQQLSIPVGWWLRAEDEATILQAVLDWMSGGAS